MKGAAFTEIQNRALMCAIVDYPDRIPIRNGAMILHALATYCKPDGSRVNINRYVQTHVRIDIWPAKWPIPGEDPIVSYLCEIGSVGLTELPTHTEKT